MGATLSVFHENQSEKDEDGVGVQYSAYPFRTGLDSIKEGKSH